MRKKPTLVGSAANRDAPPATLGERGAELWRGVVSQFVFDDVAGRELLRQACECLDRAEARAAAIIRDGATLVGNSGAQREHPLLRSELAFRALAIRTLARLNLDLEPIKPMGRPPLRGHW